MLSSHLLPPEPLLTGPYSNTTPNGREFTPFMVPLQHWYPPNDIIITSIFTNISINAFSPALCICHKRHGNHLPLEPILSS